MRYARAVLARGLSIAVLLWSLVPGVARAQPEEAAEAELARVDAELALARDLQISGGVILGVGAAALVGGSIGVIDCRADCLAGEVALGVGAGVAVVGLVLFLVGSFLGDDASERRRRLLRERFALVPLEQGVLLGARLF